MAQACTVHSSCVSRVNRYWWQMDNMDINDLLSLCVAQRKETNKLICFITHRFLVEFHDESLCYVSPWWVSVVINVVNSEGLWLAVTVCIVNQIALKVIPAMSYVTFTVVLFVLHLHYTTQQILKQSSYLCSFRSWCGQPLTATDSLKCHFIYPKAL